MDCIETASFRALEVREKGKKSKIYSRCKQALRDGRQQCIWLCSKRHGRTFAKDIWSHNDDGENLRISLSGQEAWFQRFSLYHVVDVLPVEILFVSDQMGKHGFEVVTKPLDRSNVIKTLQLAQEEMSVREPSECGVDKSGQRHDSTQHCNNMIWDPIQGEEICTVLEGRDVRKRIGHLEWMRPMIRYWWQHDIGADGLNFLEESGFVHHYRHLQYHRHREAEDEYSRTVTGFELVSQWDARRVLWTIFIAICGDVLVVGLITTTSGDFQIGLSAGSTQWVLKLFSLECVAS